MQLTRNMYVAADRWFSFIFLSFQLREFILLVKDNSNNNSIKEYYKFTLKYQPEQRMKNKISAKELMRSTCDLFKVIEQLGCYERAEECITLEVALTFYQRGMFFNGFYIHKLMNYL